MVPKKGDETYVVVTPGAVEVRMEVEKMVDGMQGVVGEVGPTGEHEVSTEVITLVSTLVVVVAGPQLPCTVVVYGIEIVEI